MEEKKTSISVQMEDALFQELEGERSARIARFGHISRSSLIRQLIAERLEEIQEEEKKSCT